MSNTPRIDAVLRGIGSEFVRQDIEILINFAKTIERENAGLKVKFERAGHEKRNHEVKLAEARAEIDRKDCELSMADHHIYDQKKLIEQMREALRFSLIADEVRQTRNVCASDINDACETSRIKRIAALSAAERGERWTSILYTQSPSLLKRSDVQDVAA